jgi:alpha-tubulin suppressor-like RCC1 family protein
VACGEEHSAFIANNGSIYTMGSNAEGRLGIGDKTMKISVTPCLLEALSKFNAVEIACGWGHTVAVLDNGNVYSWGVGEYGALGTIEAKTQWFPVQMHFTQRPFIKAVSCGTRHTAMIDSEGKLFVCGAGDAGQLGTGSRKSCLQPINLNLNVSIQQTACGIFHTLLLTIEGTVLTMGGNNFGQLGIGTKRSSSTPQLIKGLERITKVVAGRTSAALNDKGAVYVWGGEYLVPNALNEIEGTIVDIELGGNFAGAIDTEGDLYTWGENKSGELGTGDYKARVRPTRLASIKESS